MILAFLLLHIHLQLVSRLRSAYCTPIQRATKHSGKSTNQSGDQWRLCRETTRANTPSIIGYNTIIYIREISCRQVNAQSCAVQLDTINVYNSRPTQKSSCRLDLWNAESGKLHGQDVNSSRAQRKRDDLRSWTYKQCRPSSPYGFLLRAGRALLPCCSSPPACKRRGNNCKHTGLRIVETILPWLPELTLDKLLEPCPAVVSKKQLFSCCARCIGKKLIRLHVFCRVDFPADSAFLLLDPSKIGKGSCSKKNAWYSGAKTGRNQPAFLGLSKAACKGLQFP